MFGVCRLRSRESIYPFVLGMAAVRRDMGKRRTNAPIRQRRPDLQVAIVFAVVGEVEIGPQTCAERISFRADAAGGIGRFRDHRVEDVVHARAFGANRRA